MYFLTKQKKEISDGLSVQLILKIQMIQLKKLQPMLTSMNQSNQLDLAMQNSR
jgi:hypothetical protein